MSDGKLFINTRVNGYTPNQCGSTLTIKGLISILEEYDEDMEVFFRNDNGYTYGCIYEEDIKDNEEEDY